MACALSPWHLPRVEVVGRLVGQHGNLTIHHGNVNVFSFAGEISFMQGGQNTNHSVKAR